MKAPKEIRHKLGSRGEDIAVKYLKRNKYIIVTRNWKIKAGELDIVAVKDNHLYFVEVKTRTWRPDLANFRTLSLRQAKRNRNAAKLYWNKLSEKPDAGHFNLIEIVTSKFGVVLDLKHTQDYQMPIYPLISEKETPASDIPDGVHKISGALFFPCSGCGNVHTGKANSLCKQCLAKIKFVKENFFCLVCGAGLEKPFDKCPECSKKRYPWKGAAALFLYKDFGSELLKEMKFHRKVHIARILADMAADFLEQHPVEIDGIVAVPMPLLRLFMRRYNQAEVFAKLLAKRLQVPVFHPFAPVLYRNKQSRLNIRERAKSRRKSFSLKKSFSQDKLEGLNILLVDDIFTTGATLKSAGRVLKKTGLKSLNVLTCAYTPRYSIKK